MSGSRRVAARSVAWVAFASLWALTPLGAASRSRAVVLRVLFADGAGLSAETLAVMREEVAGLLEPWEVRVEWLVSEAGAAEAGRGYFMKTVLFDSEPPASWRLPPETLGTIFGQQRPAEGIYLFYPVIRRRLMRGPLASPSPAQEGRALARVLVHELVHAFAPQRPHTRSGLMAESLHRGRLLALRTELDAASAIALVEGLRQVLGEDGSFRRTDSAAPERADVAVVDGHARSPGRKGREPVRREN